MFSEIWHQMRGVHGVYLEWGTALEWNIIFTFILCVMILLCIGVSLVFYRGRQTEGNALWLHLLGLCIFPLFLLPFGNFTIFEYSKQERFCASCHPSMDPYVNDLTAPDGKSLAATHYQDRFAPGEECYTCHANYGVHGTFTAKVLGLNDAWRELTGTYSVPIKMRQPYPNMLCLKCHNGARKFMKEDSHTDAPGVLAKDLLTDQTRCTDCHVPGHMLPGRAAAPVKAG
ncbi:MAG TPA: NapC/NirT family cytochrome c [Candidatus Binataceae bacterium]|jgi:nitrate/TMAO reductase-like tetraheme cytochrome c subunit